MAKETANIQTNLNKVEDYEETFKSIKEATHIDDIKKLAE